MSFRNKYITRWVECECFTHQISVSRWVYDDDDPGITLSVWGLAEHGDSFRWRLRTAWHALKGDLHLDQVLLDPGETQKLIDALIELRDA